MNMPRLVFVTRRFWPLVGGAESVMANLGAELRARGHMCGLLTAQWDPAWPVEIEHRGTRVIRLKQPAWRRLGTWRYMKALKRWLEAHRSGFDLVYVSMLKHSAYAAISAARKCRFPVVLRAEGAGLTGDVHWQLEAPFGYRIKNRCMLADAIVAPSESIQAELIAAGYRRDRIHLISNGVPVPPPRVSQSIEQARHALQQSNPLLHLPPGAKVAVYTGRLHESKGLVTLLAAWQKVHTRRPNDRLWIVGEGPLRESLVQRIQDLDLTGSAMLAGPFDSVDEVLRAADLFVLPSEEEGMSIALLEAMAAGLSIVASDIPGNRALIDGDSQGLLVPPRDDEALAKAIERLLDNPDLAASLGNRARERVARQFSIAHMSDAHLNLFDRVLCSASQGASN